MAATTLTARWVFPVDGPPLPGGRVTVADGRIVEVRPASSGNAHDLGHVALLPGFVNAHTHLDLGGLRGACPPAPDFPAWLRRVTAQRAAASPEAVQDAIAAGIAECLTFGTTLVGDIAGNGASWQALAASPLRAVVFHELLGLSRERAGQSLQAADAWLATHPATATCRPGLSPHAPYSVHRELFAAVAERAARQRLPVAVHVAESRAELEFLRSHAGPFVAFLQERGVWQPDGLIDDLATLAGGFPRTPTLFVHGNYWPPSLPLAGNQSLVVCPRTHAAFGHEPHPFPDLLRQGVRVALGTDSLASNPDLDLLAEARFLAARHPDIDGAALLRMLTLDGAAALGWDDATGSLTPGKSADLVILPLPERDEEPHRLVFASPLPVRAVMAGGRWLGPPA